MLTIFVAEYKQSEYNVHNSVGVREGTRLKVLEDFQKLESGCVELNFENLKRFRNSQYSNKYSEAVFHILERLQKSKHNYSKHLRLSSVPRYYSHK
jgi:hypothetical protein